MNNNSRTHLILKLAKQVGARQDDEWEVRSEVTDMDNTSADILNSEEIQDNHENGQQTRLSVIEVEPKPTLCSDNVIVESSGGKNNNLHGFKISLSFFYFSSSVPTRYGFRKQPK